MSTCIHLDNANYRIANNQVDYYPEECYNCFDNQDNKSGVNLCLTCLYVGCTEEDGNKIAHINLHKEKNPSHNIVLNIKRNKIDKDVNRERDGAPSPKLTKLTISEEVDEAKYETIYQPKCLECKIDIPREQDEKLEKAIKAIETGTSSSQRTNIQQWEETKSTCEHVLTVHQMDNLPKIPKEIKCEGCELGGNLWLCLTCGNLGCGRQHYDGTGGNGHALSHFQLKDHDVCVKLGTITPEGDADLYCYRCDSEVIDPELSVHLEPFGIKLHEQTKTEKNMTELQLEHNLKFDFNMTTDDGKMLTPLEGPGYTGFKNLGNSCYLASAIQAIYGIPQFRDHLLSTTNQHVRTCTENPLECVYCQLGKIAYGLYSGRYSKLPTPKDPETPLHQEGVPPNMFKKLFGKGHVEFATMRQQDSYEYITHFLTLLERAEMKYNFGDNGSDIFKFNLEEKLQCLTCNKVKYNTITTTSLSLPVSQEKDTKSNEDKYFPVELEDCFKIYFASETLNGYSCTSCKHPCKVSKNTRFLSYPKVLILNLHRFALVNWVPTKLEVPIIMPKDNDLSSILQEFKAPLHSTDEELMPEDEEDNRIFKPDPLGIQQLKEMGFGDNRCIRALNATNNDVEMATAWLFEHMDDPDIDEPLSSTSNKGYTPSMEQILMLASMGFQEDHAISALKATQGDMDRAVEWIFSHPPDFITEQVSEPVQTSFGIDNAISPYKLKSFISHKGTSVHSGHYVAHLNINDKWILFNDNKVAEQPHPPIENAYIYFFHRQ